MGTGKHLFSLCLVTSETFLCHFRGWRLSGKLDQLIVVGDIFGVAFGASHRSLIPFLMATHTLAVVGALEPDSTGQLRIERLLVAG